MRSHDLCVSSSLWKVSFQWERHPVNEGDALHTAYVQWLRAGGGFHAPQSGEKETEHSQGFFLLLLLPFLPHLCVHICSEAPGAWWRVAYFLQFFFSSPLPPFHSGIKRGPPAPPETAPGGSDFWKGVFFPPSLLQNSRHLLPAMQHL